MRKHKRRRKLFFLINVGDSMWRVTCKTTTGKLLKLYLNDKISNAEVLDILKQTEPLIPQMCSLRWTPIKVGKVYITTINLVEE